ncbi:MAG: hypothetical protein KDJ29_00780 [Hyphomicrobiales bacterium]|nr:hypothetical protein [Hyphomicrobiales bacterium]
MDTPKLVRQSLKSVLACTAIISAGFILLQAVDPKSAGAIAAKITGTENTYKASEARSLWQRLFEKERKKKYSWEPGKDKSASASKSLWKSPVPEKKSAPAKKAASERSEMRDRYASLLGATPNLSGTDGGNLRAINSISNKDEPPPPPAPKARPTAAPKKARPLKATQAKTNQGFQSPINHANTAHVFGGDNASTKKSWTSSTKKRRSIEIPALAARHTESKRDGFEVLTDRMRNFASHGTKPQELRKDDSYVAASLISRADGDIRLIPHAVAAVDDFTQRHPGTPEARQLQSNLASLRRSKATELRQRSHIKESTKLDTAVLAAAETDHMRACLANIGDVESVDIATIILDGSNALPAYAVAVDIKTNAVVRMFGGGLTAADSSSDKRMISVSRCLRPLFRRGTVAFLFTSNRKQAKAIGKIQAVKDSGLFRKGFAESNHGKQRRG